MRRNGRYPGGLNLMTFILTFAIMLASITGLAVGVLLGRAPIRGSCGGMACVEGAECATCPAHRNGAEAS